MLSSYVSRLITANKLALFVLSMVPQSASCDGIIFYCTMVIEWATKIGNFAVNCSVLFYFQWVDFNWSGYRMVDATENIINPTDNVWELQFFRSWRNHDILLIDAIDVSWNKTSSEPGGVCCDASICWMALLIKQIRQIITLNHNYKSSRVCYRNNGLSAYFSQIALLRISVLSFHPV